MTAVDGDVVAALLSASVWNDDDTWRHAAGRSFAHHVDLPGLADGRAGVLELAARLRSSLRDIVADVELRVDDGPYTGLRLAYRAHASATGRPITWCEHHLFERDGSGRIAGWWPALRLHRLLAVASGEREPLHRPSASPSARAAGLILPVVSAATPAFRTDDRVEIARRYVEEFKNQQRFSVFPRVFASRFRHHFDYDGAADGMRTWVATGQEFLRGFPDVHVELHALFGADDLVVEVNRASGHHRGRFRGRAATGLPMAWNEIHIYRFAGRKIVENWPAVDVEGVVARIDRGTSI